MYKRQILYESPVKLHSGSVNPGTVSRSGDRRLLDPASERNYLMKLNIAIDGPSAAGKSTIARRLAHECGYIHLDTGAVSYTHLDVYKRQDDCSGLRAADDTVCDSA